MSPPEGDPGSYEKRFHGIARLYGAQGLKRLRAAHVCVVGIGGVGSWAVEALARSGVGAITLIDLDDVCFSNINRQLPAMDGTIGQQKIDVMAERIEAINPQCVIHREYRFFTANTSDAILSPSFDYVIDAIDNAKQKCLMIAQCKEKGIPIITMGGAGGLADPNQIQMADLARSREDSLLFQVRKRLRQEYGFPRLKRQKFGVMSVFSMEPIQFPQSDGTVCGIKEAGSPMRLDCESGFGTATFITGTFAFLATSHVVQVIATQDQPSDR